MAKETYIICDKADCEDQALVPTIRCTNWPCHSAYQEGPLLEQDIKGFWCCPRCKGSYGTDPLGIEDLLNDALGG